MNLHCVLKGINPDSAGQGILNIATFVFYNLMRFVNFINDKNQIEYVLIRLLLKDQTDLAVPWLIRSIRCKH